MKYDVETDGDSGAQTIIMISEDNLDLMELVRLNEKVKAAGVDLAVNKTEAVLKIQTRQRAAKGSGKATRGKQADPSEEVSQELPLAPQAVNSEGVGDHA